MKFLCLACDEPMKLEGAAPPAEGAGFTAQFRCPRCGQGIAMLTNPWETEVVSSLGVKLGNGRESRCPLGAMVSPGAMVEGSAAVETGSENRDSSPPAGTAGLAWTAGALARLERIPEMVRPMAREGIERFAQGLGRGVVDEALLDQARAGLPL